MLPQQPVVFISKEFFINFCKLLHRIYSEIELEEKKKLLFLEELIFQRSTVLLNISDEAIKDSNQADLQKYLSSNELNNDEKIFLIYINKIHKVRGLIKSCLSEMQDYNSLNIEAVRKHLVKPHFVFTYFSSEIAGKIQKQFGIICLSGDIRDLNENIYKLSIRQIKQREKLNPATYFINFPKGNSIIIEEPYLLKQSYIYLKGLIASIINNVSKIFPTSITLITKTSEGNLNFVKKLKEEFSGEINIEHYQRTFIHDRNIYTNLFWICSDYGFMEEYKTPTKWTSFPLGIYYSEYYERIKSTLTFLKNEHIKSNNFLAKGFNN